MLDKQSQEIYKKALTLLSNREHSKLGLRRKLLQRGFRGESLDIVLDKLENEGSLSDQRYADCYARHRCSSGFGPNRVALELREEGVSDIFIDAAISLLDFEFASGRDRYLNKLSHLDEPAKLKKLWQRGFDYKEDAFESSC
ncbi:MAG TPA: regulatory protein RecX [Gammaproteobacteria bacterium]|nr:regulatory protein RecX [Gammaproteobacteria bacterium]